MVCCSICLEDNTPNEVSIFKCQHQFHEKCIENWLKKKRSCPLCRCNILLNADSNPKIYVWNEANIMPAEIYKKSNNLNHEIVIFDENSMMRTKQDIFYHFA
jgi:hypothetical protein